MQGMENVNFFFEFTYSAIHVYIWNYVQRR